MSAKVTTRLNIIVSLIISTLYAYRLASVPSELLSDRANYSVWYTYASDRLSSITSIFSFISTEPLFYLFNYALAFLNNPYLALQVISFTICFLFCTFALNITKRWYVKLILMFFFIFELQILALQLNALRQGIALGILLLFFLIKKEITYLGVVILTTILGLFHFSFFLLTVLLLFDWWFTRKPSIFTPIKRVLGLLIVSAFLSLSVLTLLSFFGAKQAGTFDDGPSAVSGLGFIYWLLIFLYIWFTKPRFYKNDKIKFAYSIFTIIICFYLGSYFFMPVFGRIINSIFPFMLMLLLYKPKLRDFLIVAILLFQAFYTFFYTSTYSVYIYMSQKHFIYHILGLG